MPKIHICQECGKEFFSTKNRRKIIKYCSRECYTKAQKKYHANKHIKKCIICGKEFQQKLLDCGRYSDSLTCSKECMIKLSEQTCLDKFGVKNASQSKTIQEKKKSTCLEKYGNEYAIASKQVREKSKQTCLEHYGVETSFECSKVRQKYKENLLKKYGVENPSQLEEVKKKKENTCLEHYGVINYTKSKDYEDKSKLFVEKAYNTRKKNKTFNVSKIEKEISNLLFIKFPNLKTQYKSEEYPFNCDFYIPEINTYIEYQGHWTHGVRLGPFNPNNEKHVLTLEIWQKRADDGNKFYKSAIDVWTKRDPLKRQIAKENGLIWLEFFNLEDFMKWYNSV